MTECTVYVKMQATFERLTSDSESLQVSLTGSLRSKVDNQGVNIMVALYESGLVTNCPAGENKGRVLSNDYVVRKLEKLCTVKDISPKKNVSGTVTFPLWEGFNSSKCGVAVFVQNNSHHIFGSQNFQLPDNIWDWFDICVIAIDFRRHYLYRMCSVFRYWFIFLSFLDKSESLCESCSFFLVTLLLYVDI